MKIGEAQEIYREQIRAYQKEKSNISKQLQNLRRRMEIRPEEKEQCATEAATLELTLALEALDEKQDEYQEYLSRLTETYCAYWNAAVADQQADASAEYTEDMAKVMEVARRIMRCDIVPASDEKKLMEYSEEMYQTAKSVGAMVRRQKREKHKSLWGDEEEKQYPDPREAAENAEAPGEGPAVVDAASTVASVSTEG